MPASTPVYGWPYQSLPDPPDGPNLGEDLALAIEGTVQSLQSQLAAMQTRVNALTVAAYYRARQIVTVPVPSVTFSGIPSNLRRLKITYTGRSDNATTNILVQLRVNGDPGANYYDEFTRAIGAAAPASNLEVGSNQMRCGVSAAALATAGQFSVGSLEFVGWDAPHPNYLGVIFHSFTPAAGSNEEDGGGAYAGAGPYNSVTVIAQAGNWVAGSDFQLYGDPT